MKHKDTALFLFLALLWGQLFYALAPSWNDGTYYDYGWLVGPFAALFFWRRWQEAGLRGTQPAARLWLWILVAGALLLLIPLRTVQHVDVYWRLTLWMHAGVALSVTHLVLALQAGWKVSRAVLPATLFTVLAVPLPSSAEVVLVQELTHQVVSLSSALLPYAGYPVDVAGNSLIVKGELLDVAEGCSGIRSFQSSVMAGFCLGELLRLPVVRRTLLVLLGIGLAVLFNAGRIFVLARIAHDEGRAASDAAHDSVGLWVLVLTYGGLSLGAWLLLRFAREGRTVVRTIATSHG